jgi:glycosyltransferase involved in cell wall biosynthesis
MPDQSPITPTKAPVVVSIILPTYNRAQFLPEAFAAIRAQQLTDWELIIIDDGSTDNTRELAADLAQFISQPVRYIYQENQGAYGARNTGLDNAVGRYIAFYDSDDIWLPHHLADCVEALEANPEVHWVYGACRMVDDRTGNELAANTFYIEGQPRPFQRLKARNVGDLHIIDDAGAARCQISHGLYCGLQNSVICKTLFDDYRFNTELRNEAEDQVIVIWALASGFRFAYCDNVHVEYHVHDANSSLAGTAKSLERRLQLQLAVIQGFERLMATGVLNSADRRALKRRVGNEYFWHLGYVLLWQNGRRDEAVQMYRRAIGYYPRNWRYWKTLCVAQARMAIPQSLKHAVWWVTDSKWRSEYRRIKRRISKYRHVQRDATRTLLRQSGDCIIGGPFRGLQYTPATASECCAHVLLGTYEKELHATIENAIGSEYDTVVDIGVSGGYYLCGFAKRVPLGHIIGFEADISKHPGILKLAASNGLADRVSLCGICTAESLREALNGCRRCLIVCDVDGAEIEILDLGIVPELSVVDIIVETHDLLRPGITNVLQRRFAASHEICQIDSRPRTTNDLPNGVDLGTLALPAMDEFRGGPQSWLWMQSKAFLKAAAASGQTDTHPAVAI